MYFSGADRLQFVADYYPQHLEAYKTVVPGAYKADIFRLMVVHKFGGIYTDIKIQFKVPIEKAIDFKNDEYIGFIDYANPAPNEPKTERSYHIGKHISTFSLYLAHTTPV